MKRRLLSAILSLLLLLSLVPATVFASDKAESAAYVAFSSDVHNVSGDASATRLDNWVNVLSGKLGSEFEQMGFCGDIGPGGSSRDETAFWPNARKVMETVDANVHIPGNGFYVCGNHEYTPGNYTHNKNDTSQRYADAGEYELGGDYILYSLGARQYDEIFHDEDIAAMTAFLDSHADFTGPIFILTHFPLHTYNGKTGESKTVHDGKAAVGSAKIIAALNEAAQQNNQTIIFLWGHNHSSSNDHYDAVYTDKINDTPIRFTYASAGCMADSEYGQSANVKGKGLVAAITEETVTLTYYDANGNAVGSGATVALHRVHTHTYGTVSYLWAPDGTGYCCTASRLCAVCGSQQSETAAAQYAVTAQPTCTASGEGTYTASFAEPAFAPQTRQETIPATGHDYTTVVTAPTCTAKGYTTYTCSCGDSYRDNDTDATGHKAKTTTTKATLTKNGKITYTCSTCGETTKKAKTIYAVDSVKLSSTSYTYNGEAKKPTVTVKDSKGNTLKKDTDYTVTYASGRKAVGSYKVTVKGTGKYSFTKTLTFKINPAKAKLTSVTSKSAGTMLVKWNKVSGVTGYQIKYALGDTSKTVKVTKAATVSKTIKSLTKGKTYKVSIRTYKTVDGTTYYSAYSTAQKVTVKK